MTDDGESSKNNHTLMVFILRAVFPHSENSGLHKHEHTEQVRKFEWYHNIVGVHIILILCYTWSQLYVIASVSVIFFDSVSHILSLLLLFPRSKMPEMCRKMKTRKPFSVNTPTRWFLSHLHVSLTNIMKAIECDHDLGLENAFKNSPLFFHLKLRWNNIF